MRISALFVSLFLLLTPRAGAQSAADGPSSDKAQKSYKEAMDLLREHKTDWALEAFKKADKQDGGRCSACQRQMIKYGMEIGDWKAAELAAQEMITEAQGEQATALAHYQAAALYLNEGIQKRKDEYFTRVHEECLKATAPSLKFPDAVLLDGRALAYLHQDAAATERFQQYLKMRPDDDLNHQRVLRYAENPELARARMAPPFILTALDGQHISMDDLKGKVVLLDFWATWCGPCREALPHIRNVAKKFKGQPLVVLSISLDGDEQKWKDFIAKNEMTWPQYRDGDFNGAMAKMFGVTSIPHTFTIDADGVLQEEHVGDASIEGKIKKLIARAEELRATGASLK